MTADAEIVLGLTGHPLGHSRSPKIHAAALAACGLSGRYELFPIPPLPDGGEDLAGLLARVRSGEIDGLNVTIPHKQAVLSHLDRTTPAAAAIGAVNTIYMEDGALWGENTDAPGFLAALDAAFGLPAGLALVLGAGGSARAVAYALRERGWEIHVSARRRVQAEALAADFGLSAAGWPPEADEMAQIRPSLVVNTTPVGMFPHGEASPWPAGRALPDGACVYDLVYNPRRTRLFDQARAQGLPAENGLGMLAAQAALSFEIWTGCAPPPDLLLEAAA